MEINKLGYQSLVSQILAIIGVLLALTTAVSLAIIVSPIIYYIFTWIVPVATQAGQTHAAIQADYAAMYTYLLNPFQKLLQMPHFTTSTMGAKHFADVKFLMQIALWVSLIGNPLYWWGGRYWANWGLHGMYNAFKMAQYLLALLFFLAMLDFSSAFTFFHIVFFNDATWLFNPVWDPVILVLPQSFFLIMTLVIVLNYIGLSWIYFKRMRLV